MKKILYQFLGFAFIVSAFLFVSPGCDPTDPDSLANALGWFGIGGALGDDTASIENGIIFNTGQLPSSVDLSNQFPPIGDQGQYGTCVAWAVGYNHKSYMEAVDKSRYTADMTNKAYVFSPKYLFWSIPSADKGADCNGTGFESAYEILISKGISTLATTPYTDLGDCSSSASTWDAAASQYPIESYRQVDVDLETLKQYLAQGRALSFGAELGENFMAWNSSDVIYSDTEDYNGQHAYHAMTLCGYDDSKGTNGAFKVVNSWGSGWGNSGFIWVDYNFFISNFAFCAFAATNSRSNPDDDGDNVVDNTNSGDDLLAWELYDLDNGGGTSRVAKYNAFNSGSTAISASKDWNIIYIYYNAYNANDYGIMLYDYYSDDYGVYGAYENLDPYGVGDGDQNWLNYFDIPAGQSVAQAIFGTTDARFEWPYTMPTITGEYYLVIIVDGYNVIDEFDEQNNYFYLTDANGGPITFSSGIMQEATAKTLTNTKKIPQIGDDSPMQTVKNKVNLNTYTTQEITNMLIMRRESGDIQRKAAMFEKSKKSPKIKG